MFSTSPYPSLSTIRQAHCKIVAGLLDPLVERLPDDKTTNEQVEWLIRENALHRLLYPKALQNFALTYLNSHSAYDIFMRPPVPDTKARLKNHLFFQDETPNAPVHFGAGNAPKTYRNAAQYPMTREEFYRSAKRIHDPVLQKTALILKDMVDQYCIQIADLIEKRYDHMAVYDLSNMLVRGVSSEGIWFELMPFIALDLYDRQQYEAPREAVALSQAFSEGHRRAKSSDAFIAKTNIGIRTCPFKTPLRHLLDNTRLIRHEGEPWSLSPDGRPLIAVIYDEYVAPNNEKPTARPIGVLAAE